MRNGNSSDLSYHDEQTLLKCMESISTWMPFGAVLHSSPINEPIAMSFTIPLTGSTIIATAAFVTECTASADCMDFATPMCSVGVCVAMSCGGGSFIPDGAYDSLWDGVRPMTGLRKCCPGAWRRLSLVVSTSVLHSTWQWITSSTSCACLLSVTRLSQTNQTSTCDV